MRLRTHLAMLLLVTLGTQHAARADIINDWNEKAVNTVLGRGLGPPPAERVIAMMHLAIFDAVNSVDGRYKPYLIKLPAGSDTSKEAAAVSAAATILAAVDPKSADSIKAGLAAELDRIPQGPARTEGLKLGEAVALNMIQSRANDGANAPEAYRPVTTPGVYVPTPPMFVPQWPKVRPFAMTTGDQFRPQPPVPLDGERWAADYNEIKAVGRIDSSTRTDDQTQAARFWLSTGGDVYYPLVRTVVANSKLDLLDRARLLALVAAARADGLIAVFDAKYHYNFWRPITAIRYGDEDGNPATERDATWQPIADTPMHPEYPCAHCVQAASMCAVLEAVLGSRAIVEVAMTSKTAPGVTRRWTDLRDFVREVSDARIWAGFHYRFSTEAGAQLGYLVGRHVSDNLMQPVSVATR